jgi:branched-chain amino acid transport system substrate-binding protein
VADAPEGWSYLVARGRRTGYRTVLAPDFLVDRGLDGLLASRVAAARDGGDQRLVEVDVAELGRLTVAVMTERPSLRELDVDTESDELATDEHGRPLRMLFGVVVLGRMRRAVRDGDLQRARGDALVSYRRFLAAEDRFETDRSIAVRLNSHSGLPHVSAKIVAAIACLLALAGGGVLLAISSSRPELTVYSSLPFNGPERDRARDIERGIRLALEQAHGEAGSYAIRYRSLDDSTAAARGWTSRSTAANAGRAAGDGRAAVYIGDLDSGASAVSIPVLSKAHIAQISPSSTAVGLTTRPPGGSDDEPRRYYAGGVRNFVRIVPSNRVAATALMRVMRAERCARLAIVEGRDLDGRDLARSLRSAATAFQLRIVFDQQRPARDAGYRVLARAAAARSVDCIAFAGDGSAGGVGIEVFADTMAKARLYGSGSVSFAAATGHGALPASLARRLRVVLPAPAAVGSTAAGRLFLQRFKRAFPGVAPAPDALYGYEAMGLALSAIKRSRSADRREIVAALFATQNRRSALGAYSIDDNGDITSERYARFELRGGAVRLLAPIDARP